MSNLDDLMSQPVGEVKAPPPLPQGTYLTQIIEHKSTVSQQKQTPGEEYEFKLLRPMFDPNEPIDLSRRTMRHTFYITPDALHMFAEFIKKFKDIPTSTPMKEAKHLIKGKMIAVEVSQKPMKRKSGEEYIGNEITGYLSYEA